MDYHAEAETSVSAIEWIQGECYSIVLVWPDRDITRVKDGTTTRYLTHIRSLDDGENPPARHNGGITLNVIFDRESLGLGGGGA